MPTRFPKITIARFTLFTFIFLLISNTFSFGSDSKKDITDLIKQGEELYKKEKFEQALDIFQGAISYDGDLRGMTQLYLNISRTYFRLNNQEKSEEYLRKMFESAEDTTSDETEFEDDYRMLYKKIAAEYWFSVKPMNRIDKLEDRRIIVQQSKKPEKKRNKLLPLLMVGGILIASAVGLVLLLGNETVDSRGTLIVTNKSELPITVLVKNVNRQISPGNSVMIYLEAGSFNVEIQYNNIIYTFSVEIKANQTSTLTFSGSLNRSDISADG